MGQQVIKQPNGLYAVWSSMADAIVFYDATPNEILEYWLEEERERLKWKLSDLIAKLDQGIPAYHQFTKSWEKALELTEDAHGETERKEIEEDLCSPEEAAKRLQVEAVAKDKESP